MPHAPKYGRLPNPGAPSDDEGDAIGAVDVEGSPFRGALRSNLDAYDKGASTFSVEGHHPPSPSPRPRAPPPAPLPSTAPLATRRASAVAPVASSARSFITAAAASLRDAGVTAGDGGGDYRPSLPPSLHGAPATEAEGREVLSRLARVTQYTAQDFDPVECDVDAKINASRGARDYAADETWRHALATAIGVAMGGLAFIVDASLEALNDWKFGAVASAAARGGRCAALGALLSCVLPLAVAAALLVASTTPLAAGSGIPETKAYLNGVHVPGLLRASTLAAKLASITLGMAAGLPAGKEGPFVHAGAVVGGGIGTLGSAAISRVFNRRVAVPRSWGGRFRTDADHRDFVFIGAAAGVAVAFGAPVGGLLLAVEEGASFLGVSTLIRGFLATCTGVTTLQLLDQARSAWSGHNHHSSLRLGIQRDLGLYNDDTPGVGARFFFLAADLPFIAALGAAAGLYGAAFIRLHVALAKARAAWVPPANARRRVAEVATVAALTAAIFLTAAATSPCAPVPPPDQMAWYDGRGGGGDQSLWAGGGGPAGADGHASHFPRLWCPPGQYSTRGQLFVAPLVQATRRILHLGELAPGGGTRASGAPSASTLALWLTILPPLTLLTFGLGTATGVFIPSLEVGGAAGRLVGLAAQAAHTTLATGLRVSLPTYAAVGAAATLCGVTRMTVAVVVLAMEGAGALQAVVPIMLAVLVARAVGDAFGPSIYDVQIKMRGVPVLSEPGASARQRMALDKLSVAELAASRVVAVAPTPRVGDVADTLTRHAHAAFPVTPAVEAALEQGTAFEVHGVVSRHTLVALLANRTAFFAPSADGAPPPPASASIPAILPAQRELLDSLASRPFKFDAAAEAAVLAGLTPSERDLHVDVRPFMRRAPFVLPSRASAARASAARAHRLFRGLGVSMVLVGPARPLVRGVLTRKDVTEANAEACLGAKAAAVGRGEGGV